MKKLKILSVIIICNFHLCYVQCQNIEQTLAFANTQIENRDFLSAINGYKRVSFFDELNQNLFYKIANAYETIDSMDNAVYYYNLAKNFPCTDSCLDEITLKIISCRIHQKEFQLALMDLLGMKEELSYNIKKKKTFYTAVTYFGLEQYEESKTLFLEMVPEKQHQEIENIFKINKKIKRLNPKAAKILSMIIPGLGQFYCGDVKSGVNSFLLTTGFILLGIHAAINYTVFDSFAAIMPWYQRYFMGGYNNAEQIAIKKIEKKRNKVFTKLIYIISSNS